MKRTLFLIAFLLFCTSLLPAQDFSWIKVHNGAVWDEIEDIEIDAVGNIYALANFEGTVNIAGQSFTSGYSGFFFNYKDGNRLLIKFDANGNALWARQLHSTGEGFGGRLTIDAYGRIHIAQIAIAQIGPREIGSEQIGL